MNRHTDKKICKICGKELAYVNTTGLCSHCLHTTEIGKQQMIASGKHGYATMKVNGTHKPWQSRNIISYAEKFWTKVLANNGISYQRELAVKHERSNYFLDFYIEVNGNKIDLEIDGKQHQYKDRIESDTIRDNYLKSLGYIIYRIPWNEINSEAGKLKMQNKISRFLEFYNAL
jgi:very-short-patch-repair endonuclease